MWFYVFYPFIGFKISLCLAYICFHVRLGSSDVFLLNSFAVGGRAARKKWTLISFSLTHIRSKVGDNNAPLAKLQQSRVEAKWSLFQEASAWLEVLEWTKYLRAARRRKFFLRFCCSPR
jgi:hypothetical protein